MIPANTFLPSAIILPKVLLSLWLDMVKFVVRYGKELLQIIHLASGDTPEPRAAYTGSNQAVVAAEFSE